MIQADSKRIGLLGGAFNPPHLGHLKLAELALRHLNLDELRFVPTSRSPHKAEPAAGPDGAARFRLLEMALAGTGFRADPIELERGHISYTVDTLECLNEKEPGSRWILLMGADQLAEFPKWFRMDRILELASLGVAPRPGFEDIIPGVLASRLREQWSGAPGELVRLPGTELPLSSSALRDGITKGDSLSGLQAQVEAAIRRENYYR